MHRFGAAVDDDAANAVVSGLDTQGGGTWLGVNRHGRIAMITNITEELLQRRSLSRGHLVSDFLLSDPAKESMQEYIDRLLTIGSQGGAESERDYAGFNLVLISFSTYDSPDKNLDRKPQIALVTNSGASGVLSARWMSQDDICLGGMSNGIDGKTMQYWTKIEEGKQSLRSLLDQPDLAEDNLVEGLFGILSLHTPEPPKKRDDLRASIRIDPVHLNIGRGIQGWYGTRTSTVLLIRREDNSVRFHERDIWQMNKTMSEGPILATPGDTDRRLEFQLSE